VSLFSAIIILCISNDFNSCAVIKHPATFADAETCQVVLAEGLKFIQYDNPYKLEGKCLKFDIGVDT